jgi:hypothetical protein
MNTLIRALGADHVLEDSGGHEGGGKDWVVLADHGSFALVD